MANDAVAFSWKLTIPLRLFVFFDCVFGGLLRTLSSIFLRVRRAAGSTIGLRLACDFELRCNGALRLSSTRWTARSILPPSWRTTRPIPAPRQSGISAGRGTRSRPHPAPWASTWSRASTTVTYLACTYLNRFKDPSPVTASMTQFPNRRLQDQGDFSGGLCKAQVHSMGSHQAQLIYQDDTGGAARVSAAPLYAEVPGPRVDAQTPRMLQVPRVGGVLVLRSHAGRAL